MLKTKTNLLNQIRRYRLKRGLSQKQVSLILGLKTQAHLCRWEAGTKVPSLINALKLASALKCPVEILFKALSDKIDEEVFERKKKLNIWELYE